MDGQILYGMNCPLWKILYGCKSIHLNPHSSNDRPPPVALRRYQLPGQYHVIIIKISYEVSLLSVHNTVKIRRYHSEYDSENETIKINKTVLNCLFIMSYEGWRKGRDSNPRNDSSLLITLFTRTSGIIVHH